MQKCLKIFQVCLIAKTSVRENKKGLGGKVSMGWRIGRNRSRYI